MATEPDAGAMVQLFDEAVNRALRSPEFEALVTRVVTRSVNQAVTAQLKRLKPTDEQRVHVRELVLEVLAEVLSSGTLVTAMRQERASEPPGGPE